MGVAHKIGSWIHNFILMTKDEKKIPIVVPTDKDKLLDGKIALITGGSSGIGLAIAEAFTKAGAKVVIAGTKQEKIDDAIIKFSEKGLSVKGIRIDVRNVAELQKKVDETAALYGTNCIDILVNSAGVVEKNDFWHIKEKEYDTIMDTNAKGTFFMCQTVGRLMVDKGIHGHILNISSSSALRPAWTPYQMSKWSIRGFTVGLADELIKYGIIVNAIAPGPTATPMMNIKDGDSINSLFTRAGRYAMPEEIASLAVYMVSGAGDMIIGDTVYATGGSGVISLHH